MLALLFADEAFGFSCLTSLEYLFRLGFKQQLVPLKEKLADRPLFPTL